MADVTETLAGIKPFLPNGSYDALMPWFRQYPIALTITRDRKTILGNYRPPQGNERAHRISVNGNLNPYSFLVTLLHELAHLATFVQHRNRVKPHGEEWKTQFRDALLPFINAGIFPKEVSEALTQSFHRLSASTCTDENLFRALWKYDVRKPSAILAGDLPVGAVFRTADGRDFQVLSHGRSRLKCRHISTQKLYLLPFIYEVERI